jgi:hypothetical protein
MRKLLLSSALMLALTGCAQQAGWNKGATQPRALLHSIDMPFCIFLCQISASITSTESGNAGSVTGGDLQSTQTYAPQTTTTKGNLSPTVTAVP